MRQSRSDPHSESEDGGPDHQTLALAAIGWTCSDQARAERLLSLTGLDPDALRAGLNNPSVLVAALDFLADHEPDLLRCAEALAVTPEEIIAARAELREGRAA